MIRAVLMFAIALVLSEGVAAAQPDGLEIWKKIHQVFSHPRCVNCHVGDDNIPRWSGPNYGAARPHGMNIDGGESRIGAETLTCAACHMKRNSKVPHGPPGSQLWALPPAQMQWWGKSSAEICEQIKDPDRNGDRRLAEIAGHIEQNELVHWAWEPGVGREPAPYSREELVQMLKDWAAAGAPCPQR